MDEIITRLLDLPDTIHGFTVRDASGDFNIYLNSKLSNDQQLEAYQHEVSHIQNGDFGSNRPVGLIEIYAHGIMEV